VYFAEESGSFQGYREQQMMTSQGVIRVKRAYFTCERCGRGFSPWLE